MKNIALRQFAWKLFKRKLSELEFFCSSLLKENDSPCRPKTRVRAENINTRATTEVGKLIRKSERRNARKCVNLEDELEVVDIEDMF